jgi:hypothetical protein
MFNRAYEKAARATPGHPARLTDEEDALLLKLSRLHTLHCRDPKRPNCADKGGYLRGEPWYGNNPELARRIGIRV